MSGSDGELAGVIVCVVLLVMIIFMSAYHVIKACRELDNERGVAQPPADQRDGEMVVVDVGQLVEAVAQIQPGCCCGGGGGGDDGDGGGCGGCGGD